MVEKNAIIENVTLTTEDHGMLSAWLYLTYGGSGQGFGGYALYSPRWEKPTANLAGLFIWRVMEVVGVTQWEHLKGKTIRVRATEGEVKAIGHIIEDKWFEPQKEFAAMKPLEWRLIE